MSVTYTKAKYTTKPRWHVLPEEPFTSWERVWFWYRYT